jgi:hypothetical protein
MEALTHPTVIITSTMSAKKTALPISTSAIGSNIPPQLVNKVSAPAMIASKRDVTATEWKKR